MNNIYCFRYAKVIIFHEMPKDSAKKFFALYQTLKYATSLQIRINKIRG